MKNFLRAAWPVMAMYCLITATGCQKGLTTLTPETTNSSSDASSPFVPSATGREAAEANYQQNYLGSAVTSIGWTGSVENADAGTTPDSLKQRVLQRVNYFRSLCGLPVTTLNNEYSFKAQQAALMMTANDALNHNHPSTWKCFTTGGQLAAANSNLSLGVSGPDAIDAYIQDEAVSALGHRRWVLFPPLNQVGTGDTDNANALYVIGAFGTRPSVDFTAYPGNGYIPAPLVYDTWSFSISAADFTDATVKVSDAAGVNYPVNLSILPVGYGDNTISWSFNSNPVTGLTKDQQLNVTVSGVKVSGQTKSYQYAVYVFVP